jgi:amino acid carrier protein
MKQFLESLTTFIADMNGIVWGPYFLIPLLCGTGLYFTIRLGGVQVTKFGMGWKRLFGNFSLKGKEAGKHGMSSFQAVATAIAAQVGTGNLVGAMTALIMGGPGAIFWMWLAAFAGMATNFAEACIAQVYKTKDASGQTVGGPAYYISEGLGNNGFSKFLAGFFAVAIILALGFMGNMVQANSISDAFQNAFHIPTWVTGVVLALIAGAIFMGGVKRIASVTEKIVPIMAIVYIAVGLVVICLNAKHIPEMFVVIFKGAFNPRAVWGGALGFGIGRAARYGIARGLFSNEAGMGSTPHAHAVANVKHPVEQGVLGIVAVFIDTFIVLNITVFTVLSSGVIKFEGGEPVMKGIKLVQEAFSQHLFGSGFGYIFVAICLLFFAFSTIIGWYYFGETNIRYLFGTKALLPYRLLVVAFVFLGSLLKIDLVWELSDFFNGIMVIPNLIALIVLSGTVAKLLKDYNHGVPFDVGKYKK